MSISRHYSLRERRSYETYSQQVRTSSGDAVQSTAWDYECVTPQLSATQATTRRRRTSPKGSAERPTSSTRTPRNSKTKRKLKKLPPGKTESGKFIIATSVPLEVDDLRVELIDNTTEPDRSAENLTQLTSIFEAQLPKMPEGYVAGLVCDRNHRSLALISQTRGVIGGICFREFAELRFVELVFLAVSEQEQVKGYGTYLMNNFKEYLKSVRIYRVLTYADKNAVLFFEMHCFYKGFLTPLERFRDVINHYRGAILMECSVRWKIACRHLLLATSRGIGTPLPPFFLRDPYKWDKYRRYSTAEIIRPGEANLSRSIAEVIRPVEDDASRSITEVIRPIEEEDMSRLKYLDESL